MQPLQRAANHPPKIALIAEARRWRDALLNGRATLIKEITTREGLAKGAASLILPLAWLASYIGCAVLEGRQPAVLTSTRLRALPRGGADQRARLGFPAVCTCIGALPQDLGPIAPAETFPRFGV